MLKPCSGGMVRAPADLDEHGCDVLDEDETCLDESCCAEGMAAY